jgi:chemotaxis protein MotB
MRFVTVVAVVALASGCVKKSTHQKALTRIAELEGDLKKTQGELDAAKSGKSMTEVELQRVQTEKDASDAELAELREKREADQRRLAAFQDLQQRFQSMVDAGDLEVAFRKGQMTLKLPSGVLFPSGNADLSEKGQKTLAKVVKVLLELKDRRFLVAGHTDNVPIKTELFANNWYLSTARAISVVQYMVELGFPAKNLAAAGYADTDPIAKNKSAKGRAKNRRIEIIVVPDLSDLPKLAKQPAE